MIDHGPTNQNGLRGARALRDRLRSHVRIEDVDLDSQFGLPREHYGLVFLLGILYHLQNPFFMLRELSQRAEHCLLSTKVARFAGESRTPLADLPVAYLVGPSETNNDATNYWMFSPAGLARIVERAGWSVLERASMGDVAGSDPSSPEHDERMLLLLRSARWGQRSDPARHAEGADAISETFEARAPAGTNDTPASEHEKRTGQQHEARGAPTEVVSTVTAELNRRRDERDEALRQNRDLREHGEALDAEVQTLRQALQVAHEQAAALRNMKVVRWTAWPRRLIYSMRARRG